MKMKPPDFHDIHSMFHHVKSRRFRHMTDERGIKQKRVIVQPTNGCPFYIKRIDMRGVSAFWMKI